MMLDGDKLILSLRLEALKEAVEKREKARRYLHYLLTSNPRKE